MEERIKIGSKLLILAENFSQIFNFNLKNKNPFVPKADCIEFNLGRKNILKGYPYSKVILKQDMTKEPTYRAGIDPLNNSAVFTIVAIEKQINNGNLEITKGMLAKWMGMSQSDFLKAITDLTKEIDEANQNLIRDKKENIVTMKRYQDGIIDLEARYSSAFIESLEDLAEKISERDEQLAKKEQKELQKERRKETEGEKEGEETINEQ